MDDRYEARNKLEAYLKSSVNNGDYIVKTTPDKALPSEIYKMIMDEINKPTPKQGGLNYGKYGSTQGNK